ncbi:MAG: glycosyltransferase [Bacteroidales bacterium]|jgi:glycosyltransferase involved in cell wall biosynthesis|nr:glycosyltransferase [Bacteroidales bacterium]
MNKKNPLVTVITVTYNAEKHLEHTILSVVNQTYRNIEYIIIDGKSTDKTIDIIKQYSHHISIWVSESDNGIYDAMNKGIRLSHGELIGILNAGDFYQLDAVEKIINAYFDNFQTGIFHGNINYYFENGLFFKEKKANPDISILYKDNNIFHPTFFVTKLTYHQNGLFDTHYKIAADMDLAMRNYNKGTHFFYLDEVITNFRMGGVSAKQISLSLQERFEIIRKYGCSSLESYFLKYKWKYQAFVNTVKGWLLKIMSQNS